MGGDRDGRGDGRDDPPGAPSSRTRPLLLPRIVGEVALDLATAPEGRAAGLSVEVWPDDGVWLRVRSGHELRVYAVRQGEAVQIRWERNDPQQSGTRTTEGELGPAGALTSEDLHAFVARWLSWRAGQ